MPPWMYTVCVLPPTYFLAPALGGMYSVWDPLAPFPRLPSHTTVCTVFAFRWAWWWTSWFPSCPHPCNLPLPHLPFFPPYTCTFPWTALCTVVMDDVSVVDVVVVIIIVRCCAMVAILAASSSWFKLILVLHAARGWWNDFAGCGTAIQLPSLASTGCLLSALHAHTCLPRTIILTFRHLIASRPAPALRLHLPAAPSACLPGAYLPATLPYPYTLLRLMGGLVDVPDDFWDHHALALCAPSVTAQRALLPSAPARLGTNATRTASMPAATVRYYLPPPLYNLCLMDDGRDTRYVRFT